MPKRREFDLSISRGGDVQFKILQVLEEDILVLEEWRQGPNILLVQGVGSS